jgi:hypothetical protein
LSYAVTQSGRGSGDTEKERILLNIATLNSHVAQIQTAILRMGLWGTEAWKIDYSDNGRGDSVPSSNTGCIDNDCKLFHPAGGGVAPFNLPEEFRIQETHNADAESQLGYQFKNITVAGIGSLKKDLMFSYMGVTREFCRIFNDQVGFPNGAGGEPLRDNDGVSPLTYIYYGTLTEEVDLSYTSVGLGDELSDIDGTPAFCVKSWSAQDYYYIWILLIAR